tara:strand:- start:4189 stop:5304 length:1116 start_codon:yes stop_codon:yes gene_type:complete
LEINKKKYNLVVLPGDGVGPEVMDSGLKITHEIGRLFGLTFNLETRLVGGCSYDKHGMAITSKTIEACKKSDAVLLGAVGGPKWDSLPHNEKPETALLRLREDLALFSNLRPATVFPNLLKESPLKDDIIKEVDLIIVRELTGGIYFGIPKGYNEEKGWNTLIYKREEIERIAHTAFQLAEKRQGVLTSVHKANVLDSSHFWKLIVHEIHSSSYSHIKLSDMYIDNAAMQLVSNPSQFDVILTQNMFGDILSDIAATISGSLGMLPSASLGKEYALYEPVHGSAPDIAGKDIANPIGMIASIAMMFNYSFNQPKAGALIQRSIEDVLSRGYRTIDISRQNENTSTTTKITNEIIESMNQLYEIDNKKMELN